MLARLPSPRKSGSGYVARCPAHDDRHASLSVSAGQTVPVVVKCMAGCEFDTVVAALGFERGDLSREPDLTAEAREPRKLRYVETYAYRSADGTLFAEKQRFVDQYGAKTFSWRRPDPEHPAKWINGTEGAIPLYRLPELIGARQEKLCVIVEGERDTNNLSALGFVVTSPPNGASAKWRDDDAQFFAARRVCIIADDDEPGRKMAERFTKALTGVALAVGFVTMPNPNGLKGFDASDFLDSGGSIAELTRIVESFDKPKLPIEIVSGDDLKSRLFKLWTEGDKPGVYPGWECLKEFYRPRLGEMTIITGAPGAGKALALDTELPTPSGWTTMGEVNVGDSLIDDLGKPCRVTRATKVMHSRRCYRVEFSDGAVIVADENHQWMTRDRKAQASERHARVNGRDKRRTLRPKGNDQSAKRTFPSIKTTKEISETLYVENGKRLNHAVLIAGEVVLPDAVLPIDPYTLGYWLGNGGSSSSSITTQDLEVLSEIESAGFNSKKYVDKGLAATYGIGIAGKTKIRTQESLQAQLRTLGVLNNKHIPAPYLRASARQRMALLSGLMDSDGCSGLNGSCEFCNTNKTLAVQTHELILSLGFVATLATGRATLYGKDCGEKYRIIFTPNRQIFKVERKAIRVRNALARQWKLSTTAYRRIVKCDPVESVPVRCIEVDSPSHQYLASRSFIPTHNSTWLDDVMTRISLGDVSKSGEVNAGWRWLIYSPENYPPERHAASLLRKLLGRPFHRGPTPRMELRDINAVWRLFDDHFTIMDPSYQGCTIDRIIEIAFAMRKLKSFDGLVIDPYNVIAAVSAGEGQREVDFINHMLSKLKLFARSENVHVFIIAHPTKLRRETADSEYPVPTAWDISGGAHWNNHGDAIISLWRSMLDEERRESGEVEIHIPKIRFQPECGRQGMVRLYFDRVTTRFQERDFDDAEAWAKRKQKSRGLYDE